MPDKVSYIKNLLTKVYRLESLPVLGFAPDESTSPKTLTGTSTKLPFTS